MLVVLTAHLIGFGVLLMQGCHRQVLDSAIDLSRSGMKAEPPSDGVPAQVAKASESKTSDQANTLLAAIRPETSSLNEVRPSGSSRNSEGADKPDPTVYGIMPAGRTPTSFVFYVVKPGDTLSRIAKVHRTTVGAIQSASGLASDKLSIGQRLKIPTSKGSAGGEIDA